VTSALGQKQPFCRTQPNVSFAPKADIQRDFYSGRTAGVWLSIIIECILKMLKGALFGGPVPTGRDHH